MIITASDNKIVVYLNILYLQIEILSVLDFVVNERDIFLLKVDQFLVQGKHFHINVLDKIFLQEECYHQLLMYLKFRQSIEKKLYLFFENQRI